MPIERDIYSSLKASAGAEGGKKSAETRRKRAFAKQDALSVVFKDWYSLSLSQRNDLCIAVFGKGLGTNFLMIGSRGKEFLFNGTDKIADIYPTKAQITEAKRLYNIASGARV